MANKLTYVDMPEDAKGFVKGTPGNYYGCVGVWKDGTRYFMGVENYTGWRGDEISEALYNAFVAEFGVRESGR